VTLTAQAIADLLGGALRGDAGTTVEAMAPLDRAGPRHVSFLASPKYVSVAATSQVGVVLVDPELADAVAHVPSQVVVAKPHDAMLSLLPHLYDVRAPEPGVAATARIGRDVRLGDGVRIDDYAVIGDGVTIGDGTHIYSHVTLYPGTEIGARCIVHSGARLGCDGFGYVFRDGAHTKIPHVGRCIVGNDVEIGANATLDRGSIDDTVIGDGTKIDNLVHIAHNVRIGRLCLLMAQVGVAGSVHIGDGAILAGQVGVSGHLTVGAGARLAAQAGVFGDIPAGETWSGYPARPHREALRASGALFKLAGMMRKLERLVEKEST
jgi:UDP-3-O-[3-hydroxymyristoyl] glucosamine N-acyltransferase